MSGMAVTQSHSDTLSYLKTFYDSEICEKIDCIFAEQDKVFVKQYPDYEFNNSEDLCYNYDYSTYQQHVLKYKKAHHNQKISQHALSDLLRNA